MRYSTLRSIWIKAHHRFSTDEESDESDVLDTEQEALWHGFIWLKSCISRLLTWQHQQQQQHGSGGVAEQCGAGVERRSESCQFICRAALEISKCRDSSTQNDYHAVHLTITNKAPAQLTTMSCWIGNECLIPALQIKVNASPCECSCMPGFEGVTL
jgi:hypothetical protein